MSSPFRPVLFMLLGMLCLSQPGPASAIPAAAANAPPSLKVQPNRIPTVYENATITEDVSWRGAVVIKGALTVAPQATLRIEPGTEVRFMTAKGVRQLPHLVVMGRIQAVGSLDRPILFSSTSATPDKKGVWGGILLLSSEKRNLLEHCRIESAETALEGRFSLITLKSVAISSSITGISLRDTTAVVTASSVSGCETAIDAHDSEVELRDTSIAQNRRGTALSRCAAVMSSVTITGNSQQGILTEEGRIKMTACEVSANGVGAHIKGGEGQLFMCRFVRNLDTALHLASARLKVNRCLIADNMRDGLKLEDDRATVWGNSFSGNGGYNLVNGGPGAVNAPQNWWGAADETTVKGKFFDFARDGRSGAVNAFPWLLEKPLLLL